MNLRTRTRALLLAALATTPWHGVLAQEHPNQARGIRPETAFSTGGVDTVNGMNGGLSLSIPLGQGFPMNGGWSYSFGVNYSSNFWKYNNVRQTPGCGGGDAIEAVIDPLFNAGTGWSIGMGRLYSPADTTHNESGLWIYVDPAGGRHTFYATLHVGETATPGWLYTRDGSYLRLNTTNRVVELPNGRKHTFGASTYLSRMDDRFGNWVSIQYDADSPPRTWSISDSLGRQHTAQFANLGQGRGTHLTSLTMKAFGGANATYTFDYDPNLVSIPRTDKDTSCRNNNPQNASGTDWINVALLRRINGPEGLVWSSQKANGGADYFVPPGPGYTRSIFSGVINSLKTPTSGTMSWNWRIWTFPTGKNGFRDTAAGVASKLLYDPYGSQTSGSWTYSSEMCPKVAPEPTTPYCGVSGPRPNEVISDIRSPTGTRYIQHFTANTDDGTPGGTAGREHANWDYGLPFSCREEIGAGSRKCLSTTIYSNGANGSRQRSTWLRFTRDMKPATSGDPGPGTLWNLNRRSNFQRLKFDDDGDNRYRESELAPRSFDGLGHHRVAVESPRFGTTGWRQTTTRYNKVAGCYDVNLSNDRQLCIDGDAFVTPSTSSSWVLGIYDQTSVEHAGGVARQEFYFDAANGALDCYRVLEGNGGARGPNDIYVDLSPSSSAPGYAATERWYGGDGAGLSTAAGCINPGTPRYRIEHDYAGGVLASSRHAGTGISHFDFRATIDASTGLPSATFDPAGYRTDLAYDTLGRPTQIAPVGGAGTSDDGARTSFAYSFPTSNTRTRVTWARSCPSGVPSCGESFPQGESYRDGFGRVNQERIMRSDGGWSNRHSDYNIQGWQTRVSELTPDGATVRYTQFQNFDPLGRARRIVAPDGSQANLVFYGERQLDQQHSIATDLAGTESTFTTTSVWDGFGRLQSVQEPAGPGHASVTTTYVYDVGSRLVSVTTPTSGGNQVRSYRYDNRGLLKFESQPEKDVLGTNPIPHSTAYLHDARGNVVSVQDGSTADWLKFTYDAAERITQVRDGAMGDRLLKQFTYDTGSSGHALSKMTKAERYNYFDHIGMTALVTQTYQYQGVEGNPSSMLTTIAYNSTVRETFPQSFGWSRNGELASQTYPNCTSGGCPVGGQATRAMNYSYSRGVLTGVSYNGSTVATMTYHPNSTLAEVLHFNSPVAAQRTRATYGMDANDMARIGALSFHTGATQIANLGAFLYDGSGNLKRQEWTGGATRFAYDGVSRLTDSEFGYGGGPYRQSYVYDNVGNIGSITTRVAGGAPQVDGTPTSPLTNRLQGATYDAAGNMTSLGSPTQQYWYDALGLTTRVILGGEDWLFVYSANDERLLNYKPGTAGAFTFTLRGLDGEILRETPLNQSAGTVFTDYVYGAGLLAKFDASGSRTDYHVDHLGTPRLAVNGAGQISRYYMYYPYGEEYNAPATPDAFPIRFTGHERDLLNTATPNDDSENHHARRFSLQTARYQSPDPIDGNPYSPQTWNLYSYVNGNPMNYVDPFGLNAEDETDETIDVWGSYWEFPVVPIPLPPPIGPIPTDAGNSGGRGGGGGGGGDGSPDKPDCPAPSGYVAQLTTLDQVASFSAGFGDVLLLGFGDELREFFGGPNGSVHSGSMSYGAGEIAGELAMLATGTGGGVRAAGARGVGKEFSHWIPNRAGGPRSILNGNFVSARRHAMHDPHRHVRGMKKADKWHPVIQQADRLPNVLKGTVAGAIAAEVPNPCN